MDRFNLTDWTFNRLLDEYNIRKDKKETAKKSLLTKYEKAGSKELYDSMIDKKAKTTIIEKYGSLENYNKIKQENLEKRNLAKYGFKHKATYDLLQRHNEKYLKVWQDKTFSIDYLKSFSEKPTLDFLMRDLNCSINNIYLWIEKFNLSEYVKFIKSKYEQEILDFVQQFGFRIERNNRKILSGQELDLYIPEKQLAIEINGNYWHCEQRVSKNYRFNKSFACETLGIRLIHIYEYQWLDPIKKEIIKSIIRNALGENLIKISARKCVIKELGKKDVVEFSELNSLHGHRNASIYLGLFYNDELVQLMSFGKAFFSKDNSINYECIRAITRLDTTVIGGMNKLFKYFLTKYTPQKILYYVDYNTHNGSSMDKLGFVFQTYSKAGLINIANSKEVADKYGFAFNRKPQKHKEIQEYINQGKILVLYDAGVKRYLWTRNKEQC